MTTFQVMHTVLRTTLRMFTLIEFAVLAAALLSGGILALPLIRGPLWMDILAGVVGFAVSLFAALKSATALDHWHARLERANALRSGLH